MCVKVIQSYFFVIGAYVINPMRLHYSVQWIGPFRKNRLCVVCNKRTNWYCPSCEDVIIYFGVCFLKLHSTFT
jgi:hypothetical protein